jgi:thioredoxin 2
MNLGNAMRCGGCKEPLGALVDPDRGGLRGIRGLQDEREAPVLVDFWASWRGPCRLAAPEVARVAKEMSGRAIVLKVNTEKYPELAEKFNVQGIELSGPQGRPPRLPTGRRRPTHGDETLAGIS